MSSDTSAARRPAARPPGGMGMAWTLFRVRGVPVRLDPSILLIAALLILQVYDQFRPLGTTGALAASATYAVLFLGSILLHELGHTFASLDRGIPVRSITLFALGGITESTREARSARDEFIIVGAGPFVSLLMAAVFGLLTLPVQDVPVLRVLFGMMALTNLVLAIFNLVPGYPLDGGRLLRSILWQITGQAHRATRYAARVGQVFAALLIADAALPYLTQNRVDLIPVVGGIFTALIGLFLFRGASDAYRAAVVRERLSQRTARSLMGTAPPPIPPGTPVGQAIAELQGRPSLLWPVGDPLVGAVTLPELERIPRAEWDVVPVGRVAIPPERVTVAAETALDDVLERLAGAPGLMLLVVDDQGRPIGLLTPSLVSGAAQG